MKYLEAPSLSVLCSKLNSETESDMQLDCRIEMYSCNNSERGQAQVKCRPNKRNYQGDYDKTT